MNQELVLIRGLPGSGKSTIAKSMKDHAHVEADMFFMDDGEYKFDPSKIKDAHEWCRFEVAFLLGQRRSVVVSNTFTQWWEMRPYIDLAAYIAIPNRIIVADGEYQNVHGVPNEVVEKMRARWEP